MDSDRLDCEINRASAALPMEPALLTARTYSICFNVIVFTSYPFRRRWRSRAARRNAAARQACFSLFYHPPREKAIAADVPLLSQVRPDITLPIG